MCGYLVSTNTLTMSVALTALGLWVYLKSRLSVRWPEVNILLHTQNYRSRKTNKQTKWKCCALRISSLELERQHGSSICCFCRGPGSIPSAHITWFTSPWLQLQISAILFWSLQGPSLNPPPTHTNKNKTVRSNLIFKSVYLGQLPPSQPCMMC